MTKTLISLFALAAIATQAAAEDSITISLAGKTPAAIRAEITQAARKICLDRYGTSPLAISMASTCTRAAVRDAEASVDLASRKPADEKLASAR